MTDRFILYLLLLLTLSSGYLNAQITAQLPVGDFAKDGIGLWRQESFAGNTEYRIVELDGVKVLRADSKESASALYRKIKINLRQTPFLNWSWRVENVYNIDDPLVKKGDDYPARLYVVVKYGFFPWQTRALNYVWCNRETTMSDWPNPFTAKAIMIPVRCGERGLNRWHDERVNVVDDYYRLFHQRIDEAHGVAIMTDSDNAKGSALAFYSKVFFSN